MKSCPVSGVKACITTIIQVAADESTAFSKFLQTRLVLLEVPHRRNEFSFMPLHRSAPHRSANVWLS